MKKTCIALVILLAVCMCSSFAAMESIGKKESGPTGVQSLVDKLSPQINKSDTFNFFEDFTQLRCTTNASITSTTFVFGVTADWLYTGDGGAFADATCAASACGKLLLKTGATSNNEAYVQYGSYGSEGFAAIVSNSNNRLWFETSVIGPLAGTGGARAMTFVGLAQAGSSAANFLTDSTGVPADKDYIGFQLSSISTTNWNFIVRNSGQTAIAVTNLLTSDGSTACKLGFEFDGINRIDIYANGQLKASKTINDASYPTTTAMSPIVATKSIDNSYSPTNYVDYIWVMLDR